PLVVEQLPVTVPAGEVTEGRARLYERNTTRLHALDALRIGTVDRIARRCGLPRTATVDEVAASVASITGRPAPHVRWLLIDQVPSSDSELVRLSDALLELEDAVARGRGGPAQRTTRTDARNTAPGPGPDGPSNLDDLRDAPDERNATDHGRTH